MTIDKSDMLQIIKDFPKQCREALAIPREYSVDADINHIVVAGMGGSAIGGDVLAAYLREDPIAVTVCRDYSLPGFVNEKTLVFIISYSGNTEETRGALSDAKKKGAHIIAISSGGKISEECDHVITIPGGQQPRASLGYLFFPILGVLHNSGIKRIKNDDLNEMIDLLKQTDQFYDEAETLAKRIKDKVPIIYSSELFKPVAMRWKCQINENSKLPAFYNVFSEMNHNEIVGYQSMDRKYIAIILRDKEDHERVQKRMDICKGIMDERADVEEIQTKGESLLARLFATMYLADFLSYHLAMWNRVDPTPVDAIENLKKQLGDFTP